jgi:hypothetical protein
MQAKLRLKFRKFDETPLRVRYTWSEVLNQEAEIGEEEELQEGKLMVIESGWSLYFQRPGDHPASMRALRPAKTVPIEGCSAEIVRVVIDACSSFPTVEAGSEISFSRDVTVSSTDDHPSNSLAEHWLTIDTKSPCLHLIDPAHKVASIAKRGMELKPDFTSGLIRFALSLKSPGAMRRLRLSMIKILKAKLVIRVGGELTEDAQAYRHNVMAVFGASPGRKNKLRQLVTEVLLNGNWQAS